jgi:hypothetical protein
MLLHIWIAQSEFREWERAFNVRAARGDFVRHVELPSQQAIQPARRLRLEQLREAVGALLSPVWSAVR